jgi:hypothetical protein
VPVAPGPAALAAVRVPVLAVSIERDQYTPASTVDDLVGKLATPIADRVAEFIATLS